MSGSSRPPDLDYAPFTEESLDLLCVAGPDGHFHWLNEAWEGHLGWTREDLQARPFLEFVHADDVGTTQAEVARLAQGLPTARFMNRYRHRDGTFRWLEWTARPSDDGLIYASARDVTEHRMTLAESRRQLELLNLAEAIGRTGHWRVDLREESLYWSPEVYRIHGLDPSEFTPTLDNAIDAYHPDDRARVAAHVAEAIEQKQGFDFQLRLIRADGEERLVRSVGRPELGPNGSVVGVIGVFQDITEQHQELRRKNEELENFAYAASHDLQAPLRTMVGFAELLREELGEDLSEEANHYLERMMANSRRMRNLIQGLLDFARTVRAGAAWTSVPLNELVAGVIESMHASIEEASATVTVGDLPAVSGNASQLESLFQNLLTNALRYRSDAPPVVEISASKDKGRWRFEVSDNGQGFEMVHADRAFELFRRLEPRAKDGVEKPLGLGLSLCKRVIE
ncbi:MAG: PAS domain-containing protein, partial [Myxococcota bacterium]